MRIAWLAALVLIYPLLAFGQGRPRATAQEVEAMVKAELPVGASASDIEKFFGRHKISFSWDRFAGMYVGIIREVEPFHSITIDFVTDNRKQFVSATIRDSYTAP